MNRAVVLFALSILLLATTVAADMERPKSKEMAGHRCLDDIASFRSPRGVDHVRYHRSLSVEPLNDVQLGSRGLEGRAMPTAAVRNDQRGWLGLRARELESQLAEYFGVKNGLLVSEVSTDGPARKAGIRAGDVIVKIGSRPIRSQEDLEKLMNCCEPGKMMSLVVLRKGEALKTNLRVASAP